MFNINTFTIDFLYIYSLQTRLKFIEDGNVLSLFDGIVRQFDELYECDNTNIAVRYKNIFHLCLNVSKDYIMYLIINSVNTLLLCKLETSKILKALTFFIYNTAREMFKHCLFKVNILRNNNWLIVG